MSWPLYIVERFERESDPFIDSNGRAHTAAYRLADGSLKSLPELKVGSMWRGAIPNSWHIKFPGHGGNVSWNPWSGGSSGAKWNISGEAPTLTLTPSINHVGV